MKKADEIRKIMNASKANFKKEIERIESEILKRANDGLSNVEVSAPIEIAQKIRDEYSIHGYTVKKGVDTRIEISW